ncbi:MAG: cryptochrome/photolyase family protein [Candidatus Kapaibacteriota bacterium]
MEKIIVIWFRRDLRTEDNPLLAICQPYPVLPIFIFDKNILKKLPLNDRRITFLFEQIINLKHKLMSIGLDLAVFYAEPTSVFDYLNTQFEIDKIYASTDNDPYSNQRDNQIKNAFNLNFVQDNFVVEPENIRTKEGKPYTIFTHFRNAVSPKIESYSNYATLTPASELKLAKYEHYDRILEIENQIATKKEFDIASLGFKKEKICFEGALKSPQQLLEEFSKIVIDYDRVRNIPSIRGTSLLSVHLRFGTISIRELFRWATRNNYHSFVSELIWREFFNYILYHFPETISKNLNKKVNIRWQNNKEHYERWKNGETGIPIVDAGIRELIETGYMHNRVRMIVASFLTKNLLVDWRLGEEFFSKYLFDYELSSNVGNWQWVAGVGTDPRSATRIFNPFLQSQKFDPECKYIYMFLPQLRKIPPSKIHNQEYIFNNRISNYPAPLIKDLKLSKLQFSLAYKSK